MDAAAALLAVATRLVADLQRFEQLGFAAFAQRFAQRDALAGRELLLSDGRRGRAAGVSASGALRLDVLGSVDEVISGEVSVRTVP
jgi:BirA family biotin operon repressor/biotin-[acetyl-CoA-carboxylase] ligase